MRHELETSAQKICTVLHGDILFFKKPFKQVFSFFFACLQKTKIVSGSILQRKAREFAANPGQSTSKPAEPLPIR